MFKNPMTKEGKEDWFWLRVIVLVILIVVFALGFLTEFLLKLK
jgi:hypothetical protein